MTVCLQLYEIEGDLFPRWLSDDVDALSVVQVRIRPVGGHDNSLAVCIVSSTIGMSCMKQRDIAACSVNATCPLGALRSWR